MKRLVLVALVACGGKHDVPAWQQLGSGSAHLVGLGPAAGGGFVPGGGASSTALAGTGLAASGAAIAIDPTYTQRRVSGSCGAGQSVQVVNQDGTVTCASAGAGTVMSVTSTGGDGITVATGTTTPVLSVDNTVLQSRITGTAPSHQAITSINQNGSVGSTTFVDTAGTGLSLSSSTLSVNLTPTTCSAGQAEITTAGSGTSTCGTFVNAAGTGLSLSGSTLSANLAGGTCSNGQGVMSLSAAGTATCGNVGFNSYGGTHFEWKDEWLFPNVAVTTTETAIGGPPWQLVCSGTSAQAQTVAGVTQRPGIMEFTAGTTTTGKCSIATNINSINFGDGNWSFQWVGGIGVQSSSSDEFEDAIGFDDAGTINATDGCWFLYDRGNVASAPSTGAGNTSNKQDLECRCASNGTTTAYVMDGTVVSDGSFTTIAAPVAAVTYPNTNVMNLQVIMNGSAEADFYYNNTKSCVITTNIPSGSARITGATVLHIKSAGTTSGRTLDTDFTNLSVDLTSARSP